MKLLFITTMYVFFMGNALAHKKSLKTDLKTRWYSEFDKYEDYNTLDTLILRKYDDLIKYKKRCYVIYDYHKRNIFKRTFLNNIPDGINDISSATYEKWKIKKETDELYYLTIVNFDLKTKLIFRAIPFYQNPDIIDYLVLVKVD